VVPDWRQRMGALPQGARARVDTTPPQGVTGDRWISIDLYDQIALVYDNRQLVFATLVSTGGKPYYNPAWHVPYL